MTCKTKGFLQFKNPGPIFIKDYLIRCRYSHYKDKTLSLYYRIPVLIRQHLGIEMTLSVIGCMILWGSQDNRMTVLPQYVTSYHCTWKHITVEYNHICINIYNTVQFCVNDRRNSGRISIRCWIHKRHPISRPNRRAMGCLWWTFLGILTAL